MNSVLRSAIESGDEGYMYRCVANDQLQLNFFVLRNNMLYIYKDESAMMPEEVIFIEGCYVDKITDFVFATKFGFRLSHQCETFNEFVLYLDSIVERDGWVLKLRKSAKSKNIHDFYKIHGRIGTGKFS